MVMVQADFSQAKTQGAYSPRRVPAGEYLFTITAADVVEIKSGANQGKPQIAFKFESKELGRGVSYPYFCALSGESTWKLHNLLGHLGMAPKGSAAKFDTSRVIGKQVGAVLKDGEYQGKEKSEIDTVFSADEFDATRESASGQADVSSDEDELDLDEL